MVVVVAASSVVGAARVVVVAMGPTVGGLVAVAVGARAAAVVLDRRGALLGVGVPLHAVVVSRLAIRTQVPAGRRPLSGAVPRT